jgi:hypothetical protein
MYISKYIYIYIHKFYSIHIYMYDLCLWKYIFIQYDWIAEWCPNLMELFVRGCHNITDTSIIKLAECCHSIESLDIEYCGNITDTSVIKLSEHS